MFNVFHMYINVTKAEYRGGQQHLMGFFPRATSHGSQQQWFRFDFKKKVVVV